MKVRFTAWISVHEKTLIHDKAELLGTSENHIVRMAIRTMLGLPNALHETPITTTTQIAKNRADYDS